MRIGLDFDNTIVCYDEAFSRIIDQEIGLPPNLPRNKIALRDYLRSIGKEDRWTEIQGEVYGPGMAWAKPYDGALDFISWAIHDGHDLSIISHRTLKPFLGKPYDLHRAAKDWISKNISHYLNNYFSDKNTYFLETKDEKISQINLWQPDIYIDDLPDILSNPLFPNHVKPILFAPNFIELDSINELKIVQSWREFKILVSKELD